MYQTVLWKYIYNTFFILIGISIITLIIGISTAWLVSTCNFFGRKFFEWALVLPLSIPTYIIAYTYVGIFDYTGIIQKFFRNTLIMQYYFNIDIMNIYGIIFLLSLVLYPYIYVLVKSTFVNQSQLLLESSRILGSNNYRTFFKIALPMARPSIIGGLSLCLMEALNDYGAVKYFGVSTFTTGIFKAWFSLGDSNAAIYLSVFLILFVFSLILLEKYQRGNSKYNNIEINKTLAIRYNLNLIENIFCFILCLIPVLIGFIIPFLQLSYWTIQTIYKIIDYNFFNLILNSFILSIVTSLICSIISIFLLYSIRLMPNYFVKFFVKITILGYSIPGAIIAVGIMISALSLNKVLVFLLKNIINIDIDVVIDISFLTLFFAYIIRFLAISYNSIDSGFKKVSIKINEASRSLGVGILKTLFIIEMPLIKNSIIASCLLVFVDVLKELPLILILRPFNFETLATKTFQLVSDEMIANSGIYSLIIVIIGLFPILFLSKLINNKKISEYIKN